MSAVRQPAETEHSGRLLLRMPRALHGELAQAAEREGVSLNRLIVSRLSGSPTVPPAQPSRSHFLGYARIWRSKSSRTSGFWRRNSFAFSRPWPSRVEP